jgi:hypothetical protein
MASQRPTKPSKNVTEARAAAQHAKIDAQAEARRAAEQASLQASSSKRSKGSWPADVPIPPLNGRLKITCSTMRGATTVRKHSNGTKTRSVSCAVFLKRNGVSRWLGRLTLLISMPGLRTCGKRLAAVASRELNALYRPMLARPAPSSTGWFIARLSTAIPLIGSLSPRWANRSFAPLSQRSLNGCCWPVLLLVKWVPLPIGRRPEIEPFSGCSTIPASASPNFWVSHSVAYPLLRVGISQPLRSCSAKSTL